MSQQWYYAQNSQRHGPLSAEQLKESASLGRLSPNDLVWTAGMDHWTEAQNIPWLSHVFITPPPMPTVSKRQDHRDYDFGITLRTRNCTLAYVSLALVCLSLITGGILLLPGIVCGHIALSQCNNNPSMTGKSFAVAALVVAYVIVGIVALIVFGLVGLFSLHS
jgi:F0F1-type ATP synthase membrane subunit c/vacuolar-type H+-ATPase subunit K